MSDTLSLEDQLDIIEMECQPLIVPHPMDPDLWTLADQIELYGNESDQFVAEPMAMLRILGMTFSESSMLVLSQLAATAFVLDERDYPSPTFCHWFKWDATLRRMFPPGSLDPLLAILDREGMIEHWGDIYDSRLTIRGRQFLNECRGIFDLRWIPNT